jgi:hypothetical protein
VGRDVGRVAERGTNLGDGELVLLSNRLHGLPRSECSHYCGDINARSSNTGLAEPNIRVHRDTGKYFHRVSLPFLTLPRKRALSS